MSYFTEDLGVYISTMPKVLPAPTLLFRFEAVEESMDNFSSDLAQRGSLPEVTGRGL